MSRSQHRCVFVGNIPYDATEEQLIQICEEVGPVVSFRLVLDRDTGKPKGYGFCEFRDEETALSARRNLQGYEINGRQLRVDFAENEKNVDRNREQGRGGPGFALTLDSQKQGSGVKVSRDPSAYQPVGIAVAAAAAVAMAGTLGGPQVSAVNSVRIGQLNSGKTIGNDALTIHLASMTRHQLFEIVSQMKGIIQQNPQQARQILVANPQLTKALLQAQIMLGILGPSQVNVPTLSMSRPLVPERQAVLQSQAQASRTQPMQPLSVRSSCMQLQPIKSVQQGKIPQHQIPVTQNQMPQSVLFQPQMQSFHQSHSQMPTSQPSQTLSFLHHMQSLWQSQKGLMQPSLQNVSQLPPLTVSMSPPILSVQITQSQQPNLQKSQLPSMEQSSMSAQHLQVPVSQFHGPSDLTKLKLKSVESTGLPDSRQSELQYRPVEPLLSNQSSQQPFQVSRLTADLGGGPIISQSGFPSSGSMLSGGVSMALGAHQEQLSVPGIGASAAGPPSVTWTQDPQGGSVSIIAGILHSTASMVTTGNISASMDGNISSSNASNTDIGSIVMPVCVGNFPNATLPVEQDVKTHMESAGIDMTETSGGPITFVASSQGHSPMSLPPSQPQQVAQLPLELEQQKALLQQVMDLTLEQINSLPPEQREQVIQLQQAFRS